MKGSFLRITALLAVIVLGCGTLFAQSSTTGALEGTVSDASGPLPGVTVEVSSPSLQGTRVAVTDGSGRFRVSSLPPGNYSIVASLSGFATVRQSNVNVALGKTSVLEVTLSPATVSQEITVTADAPVVDVTSTTTGANVTEEVMETLPLDRDFYAVAQVAPGTNADASGTTFYGSTGAENQYVIDGLNTTGVELGTEAKILNFDFIEEVEVLTGGLPAEYGRITGGVINAITKSGGNEFHGDVFGYFSGGEENDTADDRPRTTSTVTETTDEFDFGFDLGGYFVKDRLWFFGAFDRVQESQDQIVIRPLADAAGRPIPDTPALGSAVGTDIERDLYAAKLTFTLNPSHTLSASLFGDPSTSDGAIFAIAGPPTTYIAERETGGNDYVARYNGIFGTRFLVSAIAGFHNEEDFITGPGRDLPTQLDQSIIGSPTIRSGGYAFIQDQEFERDTYRLDFTSFLGNHEVKVGGDIENLSAFNANIYTGGGVLVYKLRGRGPDNRAGTADDVIYYRKRFYVDVDDPAFDPTKPETAKVAFPLISEPETENTAVYLQDSWRVIPNLTLNLGVRWEKQDIIGRTGEVNASIDDSYSPRVGLIWDVLNNGRSKLYANYGRFFESVPMDINIRAFGGEAVCFCYNYDPNPQVVTPVPGTPARSSVLGGATTPVDPDLKGQYIDEVILGYDHEIRPGLALGIKGTHRDLGRVIEDALIISEHNYFIMNPGQGIGETITFYDYEEVASPKAKREYTGVELSARQRFTNNVQFFASYLWSRLEGNYDGVFQVSTGQLDPNINSAFDYADFLINAEGRLSNDREHQLKFNGSYVFNAGALNGLNVGVGAYYASGRPLTAMGYSFAYGNYEYYLTPRGSLGTGPDDYEMDLHVGYPIRLGGGRELNLLLDVFNVLDRQAATQLDMRYNLPEHGRCALPDGVECNGDNGLQHDGATLNPIAQLPGDPRASAPNPDFLQAGTAFTPPRSIRLGVKFSF